jgi:hypothetical protein
VHALPDRATGVQGGLWPKPEHARERSRPATNSVAEPRGCLSNGWAAEAGAEALGTRPRPDDGHESGFGFCRLGDGHPPLPGYLTSTVYLK